MTHHGFSWPRLDVERLRASASRVALLATLPSRPPPPRQERTTRDLFAGLSFIRRQPVSLDGGRNL